MTNEITAFIEKIPPVTKYYLGCVILFTFLVNYPLLPIVKFIVLDYDEAIFSFQIWRFVTNFFIVGKFSMKFLFFCIMMYQSLIDLEKKAIEARKYSELAMLLFYLGTFLILINYFIQGKPFLSFELLFALIYIDSKRDPEKPVALWGIRMRNEYLPFAFLIFSILTGGDLLGDIIGIIAGHIYYYLKDIVPITFRMDILKTPGFLVRYLDANQWYRPSANIQSTNSNQAGNQGGNNNNSNNNTGFRNRWDNNNQGGGGFQAFSGRGNTWG